jgi:site-specific recombinase XerD
MSIKKLDDGRYEVDMRPQGRNGKRIRRKFAKKHEATAFERYVLANQHDKAWIEKPKDARPLSELIKIWWIYHGQNMKWGGIARQTLNLVERLMGDPCAFQIDDRAIAVFRSRLLSQGIKASTVNRRLITLGGMFSFLIGAGMYHAPHPLRDMKKLREAPTAMSYLSQREITDLLAKLEGDNRNLAVLCLSTGARWGEAAQLRSEHIINQRVMFVATKNGKTRVVPISAELSSQLVDGKSGRLFPRVDYLMVRQVLREVKPDLPQGQASHVLRHTFATHFMANGGNIITLQRILGHANIQQTMTYAHFAPDYLQDAITFNPLRGGVGIA